MLTDRLTNAPGDAFAIRTKRTVIGQITICRGCCCGNVSRGKPDAPVDWIKDQWRQRGLMKHIQLTISGCLGPCDLVNVVRISCDGCDVWLGNIRTNEQYSDLVEWAERSKSLAMLQPLSPSLEALRFDPFGAARSAIKPMALPTLEGVP